MSARLVVLPSRVVAAVMDVLDEVMELGPRLGAACRFCVMRGANTHAVDCVVVKAGVAYMALGQDEDAIKSLLGCRRPCLPSDGQGALCVGCAAAQVDETRPELPASAGRVTAEIYAGASR
jgi:hypothetical protein